MVSSPTEGAILADRFRLDQVLGQGGMGVVWAATELATGERVAVKLMKRAEDNAASRRRFLREARAAAAIEHPHIVRISDVLELEDGPAIVMELLEGETLAERLVRDAPLGLGETAGILLPVASAVGAAHALGIVHRDLKPENVFLSVRDERVVVKVLDFGIAKLTASAGEGQASEGLTTTGAVLGTPAYMSPEQVFGEKDVDHRTDVWSIGMMLYECLSGILPTHADNVGQIIKIIITRDSWQLGEVVPDLPADVVELTERMLARNREARPSLHQVVEVLGPLSETVAPSFGEPAAPREHASADDDRVVRPASGSTLRSPHASSGSRRAAAQSMSTPLTGTRPALPPRRASYGVPVIGAVLLVGGAGWWLGSSRSAEGTASSDSAPSATASASTTASPSARPVALPPSQHPSADASPPSASGKPVKPPAVRAAKPAPKPERPDIWGTR